MKLCNIKVNDSVHLAIVTERGLVDATAAGFAGDMDAIVASGIPQELCSIVADSSLPVVEAPVYADVLNNVGKLVCVGLNYKAHSEGAKMNLPKQPILFSKFANALTYHQADVLLPEWETSYDYEAELVVIIGKKAWNVSEEEAMEHVFGYSCGNDLSCRDAQMVSGQWLIGKSMPGFAPCGPVVVSADSFDPNEGKSVKCYVNGELRQSGSTADMIFNCAKIISYASRFVALEPGDLIFTGTPSGTMLERAPEARVWLKKGDKVDVEIEGIGTLTNTMV